MVPLPDQPNRPALGGERLHRGGLEILLGDHQLGAGVERDVVAGVGTEIHDRADDARR